ncbi:MAG: hypothetical protein ACHQ6V_17960, partial [Myxococcota bacterium]
SRQIRRGRMRVFSAVALLVVVLATAPTSVSIAEDTSDTCACPSQSIEGKWRAGTGNTTLNLELRPDGALVIVANNWPTGQFRRESGTATGKWKVIEGRFTGSISTSDLQGFAIGYAWDDEIVASARYLVLRNGSGAFEGYVRAE